MIIRPQIVKFTSQAPAAVHFTPFSFTATDGQTVFTLSDTPINVIILGINGALQNKAAGDFSVLGNIITLSAPVDAGDHVYGVYQS